MKENKKECEHRFEISQITEEPAGSFGSTAGFFYRKVGYAICTKCGLIIKQDL